MTVRSRRDASRLRDVEAIVFNAVLAAFAVLIVVVSFDLRPGARLVPLVIGVPTSMGMIFFLIKELVGHTAAEPAPEVADVPADMGHARLSTLADLAAKEVAEDNALPSDPESVKKRRVFVIWAVAVLLLAWFFDFYVAMAVGLVSIHRYARIGWIRTVLIAGILVATVYATFDTLLGVRF